MTLQDFIKEKEIVGITKQKIPNKTMKKYLNHFKYIDTYELWYDDPDNPIYNSWVDIEGMGYGWLWLDYENSKKLQKKSIIKFAMDLYKYSKNEMYIRTENNITNIFLERKDGDCIFQIRVSNNELDWI